MKGFLSVNKKRISLEDGYFYTNQTGDTVADFIERVRDDIEERYLEDLYFEKEFNFVVPIKSEHVLK